MTMFMTTLLLLMGGLSRKRRRDDSSSPDVTPKRAKPTTPPAVPASSPLPERGLELRACLRDFAELEGIDLTSFEIQLRMEDYSPDIIPFVEDAELRKITGTTAGGVIKLKKFCKEWFVRYETKHRASH
jgi:hypothetical protein